MGYIEGTSREQTMMMTYDDLVEEESMVRLIDRFVEVSSLEKISMSYGLLFPAFLRQLQIRGFIL